ncbi:MAG: hypothetical protein WC874_03570 [Candidatus Izemoplasmatales bacterium]|jgi:hypothetical protein
MKKLLIFLGIAILGISLTACNTTDEAFEAYVTVDINPSIGFVVNEENIIQNAYALNEDGEMLLLQLTLANKSVETAMGEVIDQAMNLGFIDVDADETIIEVDALGDTDTITNQVRTMVKEQLQLHMSNRALGCLVQTRNYDSAFAAEAANKGVSPMQYRFMAQAMLIDPEILEDDALEMTPEGLITRMRAKAQIAAGIALSLGEDFQADRDAIHDEYKPQIQALQLQIQTAEAAGQPTDDLVNAVNTLRAAMQVEIQALIGTYTTQSIAVRTALQVSFQARIELNAAKVAAYRQEHPTTNNGSTSAVSGK